MASTQLSPLPQGTAHIPAPAALLPRHPAHQVPRGHRRLRPHVPGRRCGLHHHHLWLLGLRGEQGWPPWWVQPGSHQEPGPSPSSALWLQKHSAATDITSSLSDDQVPEAFLVMLLIQFSTMVVDRALYLRKTVLGKLAFQVVLVLAIHLWMFFILPAVTER